jgi:hypothetical protein
MNDEGKDLRERTQEFAIRVVRMFSALPSRLEPLKKDCNELLAILTTIAKKCKTAPNAA